MELIIVNWVVEKSYIVLDEEVERGSEEIKMTWPVYIISSLHLVNRIHFSTMTFRVLPNAFLSKENPKRINELIESQRVIKNENIEEYC